MTGKLFKFLVLTMFLVIFPLVSYLYLRRGVDFRMDVINELKNKTPLTTILRSKDSSAIEYKNKCTLVDLNASQDKANIVFGQFKDAKGFQFLSNKQVEANSSHMVPDSATQAYLLSQYKDQQFMLIDSLGNIRRLYKDNEAELMKMVVHITALLPYYNEKKGR